VLLRVINESPTDEERQSNRIEREKLKQMVKVASPLKQGRLTASAKKPKSELSRTCSEVYKELKDQSVEEFAEVGVDKQVELLFFYSCKFDRMLEELYLNLKIIVHLTIIIYLNPKFQSVTEADSEKVIVSGNLMLTFFKKYKQLLEAISANISSHLVQELSLIQVNYIFDESIFLIGQMLEESVFEISKYCGLSTTSIMPLLQNLQENLLSLPFVAPSHPVRARRRQNQEDRQAHRSLHTALGHCPRRG
jgi:hypothetical protein